MTERPPEIQALDHSGLPPMAECLEMLREIDDIHYGRGRHSEHQQTQNGKFVSCSCGISYMGDLDEYPE